MRYIYFATMFELLLDLDTDRSFRLFLDRFPKVQALASRVIILATRPHHYHVYIRLRKRHRWENLSAAAVYLGSDRSRELANISRVMAGATRPVLLIEFGRVPHWRKPDIVCSCPRKWKGRKLGNCRHLMAARGHRAKNGFLSNMQKIIGVENPLVA